MDDDRNPGPPWRAALGTGVTALAVVFTAELVAGLAWLHGAGAVGGGRAVDTSLPLFPGSRVYHLPTGEGLVTGWQPGWSCLVVGLVAAVLVARPWRMLRGVRRAAAVRP
ncbi:MAG TPA: hypothetical protein VM367_18770 [Pseudonocardia sp.]|jgi:hypothetical protein|nr:hypothetical protein [Pseudonocardia sp.]